MTDRPRYTNKRFLTENLNSMELALQRSLLPKNRLALIVDSPKGVHFCCLQCPAKYDDKEKLEVHLCTHFKEYRFLCVICGAGWVFQLQFLKGTRVLKRDTLKSATNHWTSNKTTYFGNKMNERSHKILLASRVTISYQRYEFVVLIVLHPISTLLCLHFHSILDT